MNLFSDIRAVVLTALAEMVAAGDLPDGLDLADVTVEPPRDAAHGDMVTNAGMVLAKPASQSPRVIAAALAKQLQGDPRIQTAEVAGPGFLNLRLVDDVWSGVVQDILRNENFGIFDMGLGCKVNVEFISANPTAPLHVAHMRCAVVGDALAALLDHVGYDVTREYYINDGGAQVDVLARSAYERYREACGLNPEISEGLYPGDYLVPVGAKLKEHFGDSLLDRPEADWLDVVRDFATAAMMDLIREDLAALGVVMDEYHSEKALSGSGKIEAALADLDNKGLLYEGVLQPPKGQMPADWTPRKQTLFRSTEHGDDVDRPIKMSDGAWTYFAPDIAYHFDKISRGFDALIDVVGSDHGGYVKRMKAVVSALSDGRVPLEFKLTHLVRVFRNGVPVKPSRHPGSFLTLRDVVDQVGADAARLAMLMRKNDAPLEFDLTKVREQSRDNPVFNIQYAHAQTCSVLRKAAEQGVTPGDVPVLQDAKELAVAKKLADWPRQVEIAARTREPHRIAFYLNDLADLFHALWTKANATPDLRFVQEGNRTATGEKIALPAAVGVVISAGLGILGVTPVREMR